MSLNWGMHVRPAFQGHGKDKQLSSSMGQSPAVLSHLPAAGHEEFMHRRYRFQASNACDAGTRPQHKRLVLQSSIEVVLQAEKAGKRCTVFATAAVDGRVQFWDVSAGRQRRKAKQYALPVLQYTPHMVVAA